MRVTFNQVPVGSAFRCNGNLCVKKSTRTAYLVFNNPKNPFGDLTEGSWFYFGQRDICQV
jgi:hypothetical protein